MKWIPLIPYGYALVDDDDYENLSKHRWRLDNRNELHYPGRGALYAYCDEELHGEKKIKAMHRYIMDAPPDVQVDHINGNGLDNRKSNLRFACTQTNAFNRRKPNVSCTSRYKGVLRRKDESSWLARIKYNNKHVELGSFHTEEEAAADRVQ